MDLGQTPPDTDTPGPLGLLLTPLPNKFPKPQHINHSTPSLHPWEVLKVCAGD